MNESLLVVLTTIFSNSLFNTICVQSPWIHKFKLLTCKYASHIRALNHNTMCLYFSIQIGYMSHKNQWCSTKKQLWGRDFSKEILPLHIVEWDFLHISRTVLSPSDHGPSYHYFLIPRDNSLFKPTGFKLSSSSEDILTFTLR